MLRFSTRRFFSGSELAHTRERNVAGDSAPFFDFPHLAFDHAPLGGRQFRVIHLRPNGFLNECLDGAESPTMRLCASGFQERGIETEVNLF